MDSRREFAEIFKEVCIMNMKKVFKGTLILGIGGLIGYLKGVCDTAYHVHKGGVDEETLDSFCASVDEAKEALHRVTHSAEEAVEDVTEEVTEVVEDTVEAVEETVEDVIEQVTDNQPED